jgi:[ribosomal protein S5]-alanine N-acetyltransferase
MIRRASDTVARFGSRLPTLHAGRVRLRWLEEGDAPALFDILGDPEVVRYGSRPPYTDVAQARALVEEIHDCFRNGTLFEWGLCLRGDPRIIGTATLAHLDFSNGRAEIGYAQARAFWGHGYVREALGALLDWTFADLGLRRIEADVDPRNAASIRTLEALGFVREGYLRERWNVGGEVQDALFYGLLAREWSLQRGGPAG